MDSLNLQWFDAMAVAGSQFGQYTQAGGWPKLMRPNQIAALQRPGSDSTALCKAIESACSSGVLPSKKHTTKRFSERTASSVGKLLASAKDVTIFAVNATDLVNWLTVSGQPPSEHILAWIAATSLVLAETEPSAAVAPNAWIEMAQARAREIVKESREQDRYPNQKNIGDKIAAEFRKAGVVGADGKPLTGATIKRHALKGISSAVGKQLSTKIVRGK